MSTITREWAADYASRLQVQHSTMFPLTLGRKKNWGGIDQTSIVRDEEEFYEVYKTYNDHPRCVAIYLIKENNEIISI